MTNMQAVDYDPTQFTPLSQVQRGQRAIIARLTCKGAIKQRMLDMGLVPGSEIAIVRVAPLGDPIEFTIKGYHLTLRRNEAEYVQVRVGGAE